MLGLSLNKPITFSTVFSMSHFLEYRLPIDIGFKFKKFY